MPSSPLDAFIARWSAASASERANSQPFLLGRCGGRHPQFCRPAKVQTVFGQLTADHFKADTARQFSRANPEDITEILDTLCTMGTRIKGSRKGRICRKGLWNFKPRIWEDVKTLLAFQNLGGTLPGVWLFQMERRSKQFAISTH
jgi:hypothetical protein